MQCIYGYPANLAKGDVQNIKTVHFAHVLYFLHLLLHCDSKIDIHVCILKHLDMSTHF